MSKESCIQTYPGFSKEAGETRLFSWRCKDVISCSYCRGIEEGKIRKAASLSKGKYYQIDEDHWDSYKKKIDKSSSRGYIRLPQSDGTIIVYSDISPEKSIAAFNDATTEQILSARLSPTCKSRVARTGIFAKPKKERADDIITITGHFPAFVYNKSQKIMAYNEQISIIEVFAHCTTPFHPITKHNVEEHLIFLANFIFEATLLEFGEDVISPKVKIEELSFSEKNLKNWVDRKFTVMPVGGLNNFSDAKRRRLVEMMMGAELKDTVEYCKRNGLIITDDYKKGQKESDEMDKAMREHFGM